MVVSVVIFALTIVYIGGTDEIDLENVAILEDLNDAMNVEVDHVTMMPEENSLLSYIMGHVTKSANSFPSSLALVTSKESSTIFIALKIGPFLTVPAVLDILQRRISSTKVM